MLKKWLPSLIGLSAFALLGRLLGFVREVLMASKFGANEITDAYLTTLLLFDIAIATNSSILSGTLSYAANIKNLKNISGSLSKVGLKSFAALFVCALLFYPLADKLIPLIFTRSQSTAQIIIEASRLFLILASFLVANGIFSALLQMKGDITNPGRLIIFLNVSSIAFLILFTKYFGIVSLPLGFLFGGVLFFVYQLYLIQRIQPVESDNSDTSKFNILGWGVVVLMVFGNSLLPSVSGLLERYFAYSFVEGTFSHYQYAAKIMLLPLTIFSFAISTSLLPIQTKSIAEGNEKEFLKATNNGILFSVVTSSFFVLLFSVLAEPIIQLIYQRGHFTSNDTMETSFALKVMSLGLIPFLLNPLIANIFYSLKAIKNIILINLIFIIIQAVILFILSKTFSGIETLTIAWAIFVWINNSALLYYLARVKGVRFDKEIMFKLFLIIMSTVVMILIGRYFSNLLFDDLTILESSLVIFLKTFVIGIVLFLAFAFTTFFVFRDKLNGIRSYLKELRR
ncbi:MAG: lipid II flippase MurJ [Melioribacteraceae bacterium]